MGNDEKKKGILNVVGNSISRAGELGVKAGGAIKDFAESEPGTMDDLLHD